MEFEERATKRRKLSLDGEDDKADPSEITNTNVNGTNSNGLAVKSTDRLDHIQNLPETGLDTIQVEQPQEACGNGSNSDLKHESTSGTTIPTPSESAPLAETLPEDSSDPPLSKSQQKKLRKQQEWESKREERKLVRKEKQTAKRERKKAANRLAAATEDPANIPPKLKATQLPITILIDCDFDDLMRDNERVSLAAQITRCYSDNRKAPFKAHLAVCSFQGKLRERFDHVLSHYKGWRGTRFVEEDFVEAAELAKTWMRHPRSGGRLEGSFAKFRDAGSETGEDGQETRFPPSDAQRTELESQSEIIYLSSEADETLTELRPYSTYIVGGLVDKNREKGLCHRRAKERGVRTARLPIGEFMEMQSRKVLATNHVCEIMLRWMECGDWGKAFVSVIPKRKGGKLKGDGDGEKYGDAGGASEEDGEDAGDEDVEEEEVDGDVDVDDDKAAGGVELS